MAPPSRPNPISTISCDLRDASWLYLVQGGGLVVLGVLILALPQLLVVLVATFLMIGGVLTMATGWRLRRARRAFDDLSRLLLG